MKNHATRNRVPDGIAHRTPDTPGESLSASDWQPSVGRRIVRLLVERERERLQMRLLKRLGRLPEWNQIRLTGGAALQGVFLHQRHAKDLDFEMGPRLAAAFPTLARSVGVRLEAQDEQRFVYRARGRMFGRMAIAVEVFANESIALPAMSALFRATDGDAANVYCPPLAELLLSKVGCVTLRSRAIDFADLWFGLQNAPTGTAILSQMRRIWAQPRWNCGRFTPPRPCDTAQALGSLDQLDGTWEADLTPAFETVPPRQAVREELARILPLLNAE